MSRRRKPPISNFALAMQSVAHAIKKSNCDLMHESLDYAQDHAETSKQRNAIFKSLQKISKLCTR